MQTFSKAYRAWLLAMLLVNNTLNLANRLRMAAVSQAIKLDLRFTDAQMGLIQGLGFAVLYTLLASLVGEMETRASAMSIIWLGAPLGVVVGSSLGGWMAEHVSWRAVSLSEFGASWST